MKRITSYQALEGLKPRTKMVFTLLQHTMGKEIVEVIEDKNILDFPVADEVVAMFFSDGTGIGLAIWDATPLLGVKLLKLYTLTWEEA